MFANKTITEIVRQLMGYGIASILALAADAGLLTLLVQSAHLDYVLAATISFMLGAGVAYAVSTRLAFKEHRLSNARAEFACFVAIGVIGLLINDVVIALGTGWLGLSLFVAKSGAACLTFSCNFTLRRKLLFMRIPSEQEAGNVADQA